MPVGTITLEVNESIYLLYGETGEYDDHNEWVVGAFMNVNNAEEHMIALQADAVKHEVPLESHLIFRGLCPEGLLDEGLTRNWSGGGVEYSVGLIKILDS
jgi:hypothetical protein